MAYGMFMLMSRNVHFSSLALCASEIRWHASNMAKLYRQCHEVCASTLTLPEISGPKALIELQIGTKGKKDGNGPDEPQQTTSVVGIDAKEFARDQKSHVEMTKVHISTAVQCTIGGVRHQVE